MCISENLKKWFPERYKCFDRNKSVVETQKWSIQKAGRVGGIKQLHSHIRWLYFNRTIIDACEAVDASDSLSIQLRKQNIEGYVLYSIIAYMKALVPTIKFYVCKLLKWI